VLAAGLVHFNPLPPRTRLIVDDARRFLRRRGARYGLIVLDLPAPFTLQTALLHTDAFYRLVRARLAPGGVVAASLSGHLRPEHRGVRAVASAFRHVFDGVTVVEAGEISYAYAGASAAEVKNALARVPDLKWRRVMDQAAADRAIGGAAPARVDDLRLTMRFAEDEMAVAF
jgi:spermidine synthase